MSPFEFPALFPSPCRMCLPPAVCAQYINGQLRRNQPSYSLRHHRPDSADVWASKFAKIKVFKIPSFAKSPKPAEQRVHRPRGKDKRNFLFYNCTAEHGMTRHKYKNGWLKFSQIGGVYKNFNQNLNTMRAIPRCGLHQIVICSFVCSLSLILFLNQLCSNDIDLSPGTDFTAEEITQLERKNLIQERCGETTTEKQPRRTKVTSVRLKIEDRHRVMYCDVPKVSV
jgi:hypothetical protein